VTDRVRILPENLKPKPAGRVVAGDVKGSLSKSLQKAANGEAVPTPMQALQIETTRLLKAFRDSEGRDPSPDGDPQFWDAYSTIQKMRVPESDTTKVRKSGRSEEISEKLRKRLKDGDIWRDDEPAWIGSVLDGKR
jgi:hypothetical protein